MEELLNRYGPDHFPWIKTLRRLLLTNELTDEIIQWYGDRIELLRPRQALSTVLHGRRSPRDHAASLSLCRTVFGATEGDLTIVLESTDFQLTVPVFPDGVQLNRTTVYDWFTWALNRVRSCESIALAFTEYLPLIASVDDDRYNLRIGRILNKRDSDSFIHFMLGIPVRAGSLHRNAKTLIELKSIELIRYVFSVNPTSIRAVFELCFCRRESAMTFDSLEFAIRNDVFEFSERTILGCALSGLYEKYSIYIEDNIPNYELLWLLEDRIRERGRLDEFSELLSDARALVPIRKHVFLRYDEITLESVYKSVYWKCENASIELKKMAQEVVRQSPRLTQFIAKEIQKRNSPTKPIVRDSDEAYACSIS
jgi:hypothetical protein